MKSLMESCWILVCGLREVGSLVYRLKDRREGEPTTFVEELESGSGVVDVGEIEHLARLRDTWPAENS